MIEFELTLLIDEFEATTAKETNTNSFYSIILGFNYSLWSELRRATDDVLSFLWLGLLCLKQHHQRRHLVMVRDGLFYLKGPHTWYSFHSPIVLFLAKRKEHSTFFTFVTSFSQCHTVTIPAFLFFPFLFTFFFVYYKFMMKKPIPLYVHRIRIGGGGRTVPSLSGNNSWYSFWVSGPPLYKCMPSSSSKQREGNEGEWACSLRLLSWLDKFKIGPCNQPTLPTLPFFFKF